MAKQQEIIDDKVISRVGTRAIRILNLELRIEALKIEQRADLNLLIEQDGKDFTLEEVNAIDLEAKTIVTKSK